VAHARAPPPCAGPGPRVRRAQSSSAQSFTVQSRPRPPDAIMGSVGWQLTASTTSQWPMPGASGPSRPSSTCTSCGARARRGQAAARRGGARKRKARARRGAPAGCRDARCRRRGPPSRSPPTGPCGRPPRTRQTPSAACSCGLRAPAAAGSPRAARPRASARWPTLYPNPMAADRPHRCTP